LRWEIFCKYPRILNINIVFAKKFYQSPP
jgi:hypothetical protein